MRVVFLVLLFWQQLLFASPQEIYPFKNQQKKNEYQRIVLNVRCMVCQNQSLADSNAKLAIVMRERIFDMLSQGYSEEQVNAYLRKRYGDFIFYTPPWQKRTIFLWVLPLFLALMAFFSVGFYVRRLPVQSER